MRITIRDVDRLVCATSLIKKLAEEETEKVSKQYLNDMADRCRKIYILLLPIMHQYEIRFVDSVLEGIHNDSDTAKAIEALCPSVTEND